MIQVKKTPAILQRWEFNAKVIIIDDKFVLHNYDNPSGRREQPILEADPIINQFEHIPRVTI